MPSKPLSLTRRKAAAAILLLAVALSALVIARSRGGVLSAHYNVTTTQGRVDYLAAQGWTVDPKTETSQDVVLPRSFQGALAEYNTLQLAQGFDLRPYQGLACTVYTYLVPDYGGESPVIAALYLYRNRIIAGDIHSTALDGFMHGIRRSALK